MVYWNFGFIAGAPVPGYTPGAIYLGYAPYWTLPDGSIHFDDQNMVRGARIQYKTGSYTQCAKSRYAKPYPYHLKTLTDRSSDKVHKEHLLTADPDPSSLRTKTGWAGLALNQTLNYDLPVGQVVAVNHSVELEFCFNNDVKPTDEGNLTPTVAMWEQILQELNIIWETEGIEWWQAISLPSTIADPSSLIRLTVRYVGIVTNRYINIALTTAPLAAAALILPPSLNGSMLNGGLVYLRQFVTATVIGATGSYILDLIGPPEDPPPTYSSSPPSNIVDLDRSVYPRRPRGKLNRKRLRVIRYEWIDTDA